MRSCEVDHELLYCSPDSLSTSHHLIDHTSTSPTSHNLTQKGEVTR